MMDATVVISINRRKETVSTSITVVDHGLGDVRVGWRGEGHTAARMGLQSARSAEAGNCHIADRAPTRVALHAVAAGARWGAGVGDRPTTPSAVRERMGGIPPASVESVKGTALMRSRQEPRAQGAMSNLYPTPHTVAMLHG
jgi:hypothetical protein